MPVFAQDITTYSSRSPYLTPAEFEAEPTGVDIDQLVVGGGDLENDAALATAILNASSWADTICTQVLGATYDIQAGKYKLRADCTIAVPVDNTPLIEVVEVTVGRTPATMTALSDLSNVWPGRKVCEIPIPTTAGVRFGDWVYANLGYVNGYANVLLTQGAAAGATTFVCDGALGIAPGMRVRFYDPPFAEQLTVATVDAVAATFTTTSPSAYKHGTDVAVSTMPPALRKAIVELTCALIKTRGSSAMVLDTMASPPSKATVTQAGASGNVDLAMTLLRPYMRVA